MKKHICLLLVVTMLFSFLGGCQKAAREPEGMLPEISVISPKPEPEVAEELPDEEKEPGTKQESSIIDPDQDPYPKTPKKIVIRDDIESLTYSERAALELFRNEPKEPWGENDISIYSIYGEVLRTPVMISDPDDYMDASVGLVYIVATDISIDKSTTYRGVMIGEDAIEALERMDIPKQAVYTHNYMYEQIPEFAGEKRQPYYFEEVCEWITLIKNTDCVLTVFIQLDADFSLISGNNQNYRLGQYVILLSVRLGKIENYSAGVFYAK